MNYEDLVLRQLRISEEFLRDYDATIRDRLLGAAVELTRGREGLAHPGRGGERDTSFIHSDLLGINRALHLANSVLLLGTSPENLRTTLFELSREATFAKLDPTTVLTAAVLYHLLHRLRQSLAAGDPSVDQKLRSIQQRFDQLHWMIEERGMRALEMFPTP